MTSFQDVSFNFSSLPPLAPGEFYHFMAEFSDSTGALVGDTGVTVSWEPSMVGDVDFNSYYYQHHKSNASAIGYEYILKSEVWIKNV